MVEKKVVQVSFLCANEYRFVKWFNNILDDYWETDIKQPIHHYLFTKEDKQFHISFSKTSVICSLVKKHRQRDIYKGYTWDNCLIAIMKEFGYE